MWIRSQDKKLLIKCNNIKIFKYNMSEYLLIANDDIANNLGDYDTEEEAIEVLDEIEKKLELQFYDKINSQYFTAHYTDVVKPIETQYVYQIPQKGEVK
jgi:hypothetical protein